MAEHPEDTPNGTEPPAAKRPLGKALLGIAILVVFYGATFGMAIAGALRIRTALRPGVAVGDRLMVLIEAVGLLAPIFLIARFFVRQRMRTGRWLSTPEQRRLDREQRRANACGTGNFGACGAQRQTWGKLLMAWASVTAMDRTRRTTERAAAWAVLIGYVLLMLACVAFGVVAIGAAFADDNTWTQTAIFLVLGLVVLLFPGLAVRKLIYGIREGKVGTTREELDAMRAQETAWRMRESQKPLRSKLGSVVAMLLVYAFLWLRVLLPHGKHHESWVTPAMFSPLLLYFIYVQFRPPRRPDTTTTSE